MSAFLVDARPVSTRKGSNTLFYVRDNGQTHIIEQDAPVRIISDVKPMLELEEIVKQGIEGVELETDYLYTSQKMDFGVIRAHAPRELRRDVAEILHKWVNDSRISPTASLRLEYPPLQKVVLENGQIVEFTEDYVPMQKLLQEKSYAMDIEFIDGNIFMAIMTTLDQEFGNFLFTTIPLETDYLELQPWMLDTLFQNFITDFSPEQLGTHIIYCPDEQNLIEMLSQKEQDYDGLFVFGHNIFNDFEKLRSASDYRPGIDNQQPRIAVARKSKSGEYYKIVMPIPGRFPIDTYHGVQDQNHGYNHSLAALALSQGFPFLKGSNFPELKQDYRLALKGDQEAKDRLAFYTIFDGIISKLTGQETLPRVLRRAYTLRTDPRRANSTNVINLGKENEKRRHLDVRGCEDIYSGKFYRHDAETMSKDLEAMLPDGLKENGELKPREGYFEEVHGVYPTLAMRAFQSILLKDKHLARAVHIVDELQDPFERIHLVRTLQAALEIPYAMIKEFFGDDFLNQNLTDEENYERVYDHRQVQDWSFGKRYHEDGLGFEKVDGGNANYWHLHRNLLFLMRRFESVLKDTSLVNYSKRQTEDMLFLKGDIGDAVEFLGTGINVGSGPAISLSGGGIIAKLDGKTVYKNIGLTRRRASHFEKDVILGFVELALEDYGNFPAMYDYLLERFLELEQGSIPKTRLLLKEKGELYGFGSKKKTPEEEFLQGGVKTKRYRENFHLRFNDIMKVVFPEEYYEQYLGLIENGPQLKMI